MRRACLITALLACKKQEPPPPPPPVPQAIPIDASIADASVADAIIDAVLPPDALATAEWPSAIESEQVTEDRTVGQYVFALSYPKFRTRPPALGKALSAVIADAAKPVSDPTQHQGRLDYACERRVINRLVVILECSRMNDARTLEEARQGTGGAPAGPDRYPYAVWLQPGLPAIDVRDLAPSVDIAAVLAKATPACAQNCTYSAERFVIDDDGAIRFIPSAKDSYCEMTCDREDAPKIELDQIKPTHPWAKKLDAWIRERLAAGESLVK